MSRYLKILCVTMCLSEVFIATPALQACPMCSVANENDLSEEAKVRPKAYMYSIIFMISMPATIATGFGITLYRLTQKREELNAALLNEGSAE